MGPPDSIRGTRISGFSAARHYYKNTNIIEKECLPVERSPTHLISVLSNHFFDRSLAALHISLETLEKFRNLCVLV